MDRNSAARPNDWVNLEHEIFHELGSEIQASEEKWGRRIDTVWNNFHDTDHASTYTQQYLRNLKNEWKSKALPGGDASDKEQEEEKKEAESEKSGSDVDEDDTTARVSKKATPRVHGAPKKGAAKEKDGAKKKGAAKKKEGAQEKPADDDENQELDRLKAQLKEFQDQLREMNNHLHSDTPEHMHVNSSHFDLIKHRHKNATKTARQKIVEEHEAAGIAMDDRLRDIANFKNGKRQIFLRDNTDNTTKVALIVGESAKEGILYYQCDDGVADLHRAG